MESCKHGAATALDSRGAHHRRPFVCRVPALPAPLPRARAPAAAAVRPHTSHDGAHDLMCDGHQPCPSTRKVGSRRQELGSRRQELEKRVWRIAIRRLRLVAGRIRLVAVRNIACACVRVQGYGGGMVGAASARTGSGSCWRSWRLVTFMTPATCRLLRAGICHHKQSRSQKGARGCIHSCREGSYARWRECY